MPVRHEAPANSSTGVADGNACSGRGIAFIGDRPALRALNASQDEADTSRPFASRLDLFQTPAALASSLPMMVIGPRLGASRSARSSMRDVMRLIIQRPHLSPSSKG